MLAQGEHANNVRQNDIKPNKSISTVFVELNDWDQKLWK